MKHIQLSVKAIDKENGIIEGLGIPFGGSLTNESGKKCDLEGEYFDNRTDFRSDIYDGKAVIGNFPVMYHHGMDVVLGKSIIGKVLSIKDTDKGKWFRMQLDKAHEYYQYLLELAELGALTLSTGADGTKSVRKAKDGRIIKWPLKEISLTPSAMNPNAQLAIKALNQSILKEEYMTKKQQYKKFRCNKPSGDEKKTEPVILDENAREAMTNTQSEEAVLSEMTTEEPVLNEETIDKSADCQNDNTENKPAETLKTEITVPENEKESLIQNLATISDALQSVITSLGAISHPITVDSSKDMDETHENHETEEDIDDDDFETEDIDSDISYDDEINHMKNDIEEIKKLIGLDQKARKAVIGLKNSTDKTISEIKASVSSLEERLNALETSSQASSKPVAYAENSRISQANSNQKALEQIINSNMLSEPAKTEISRQYALTEMDDLLRSYSPKF